MKRITLIGLAILLISSPAMAQDAPPAEPAPEAKPEPKPEAKPEGDPTPEAEQPAPDAEQPEAEAKPEEPAAEPEAAKTEPEPKPDVEQVQPAPAPASSSFGDRPADVQQTAPPARAEDYHYDLIVDLRMQSHYLNDDSIFAVKDNDVVGYSHLSVGHALDSVLPGLRVYFSFETALTEEVNRLGGSLTSDWGHWNFMLSADYGMDLWGWLRPSVRAGAGYALQSLTLTRSGDDPLEDYAHDFAYTGSVGLEALWRVTEPSAGGFTLAFMTQFGYFGQTEAEFDELSRSDDDTPDDGFAREDVAVGSIDTSGLFWDIGIGIRLDF